MSEITVKTGELFCSKNPFDVLVAYGIGSCVVVTAHDKTNQIGGLAHIMLPRLFASSDSNELPAATYPKVAFSNMLEGLKNLGADVNNLEFKVAGGAEMFSHLTTSYKSIGAQNLVSVQEEFDKLGVRPVASDIGGTVGRSVKLNIATGDVEIRKKM